MPEYFFYGSAYEGEFDIVVSMEVIEHVQDQDRYLQLVHGYLVEDGYLILTTPNARVQIRRQKEELIRWGLQPIENWLTLKELTKMLRPGFRIRKIFTILPGYGSIGLMRVLNSYKVHVVLESLRLKHIYNRALCWLGLGLHIVVVAQKNVTRLGELNPL